ncbi:TetR/AcrR family transcriptional regulator [Commensalibacter oyaizuii]|uniref:TetR/AcrR family transcriptional regulator n=1 Tax=Commensalibacter oyaizuii TaxID=3043873 RepID=A0ABT6Q041_9PROT|nr:TetR/AcrR family transcriptional regulator [Commensalibacter sp. TBRC 16381]MDI2090482.1 TetR/AcrR family transcriptional regulator [Commensalibacter sp. TBRC 16381]
MKHSKTPPIKNAREKILDAAANLFYEHGITATGIDTIVKKANVAKKSLYNNFASKADLITQYIDIRHQEWLNLYEKRLSHANTSVEKILAVFDAYIDHAERGYDHGFRGCGLLNAAAELPANAPGRKIVKNHKETIEKLLYDHLCECSDYNRSQADILAKHLSFLLEGAITRSGLAGNSDLIIQAKQIAISLLDQS